MKAIFVSQFEPKAVGDGGSHRAYQIFHDLKLAVGANNVMVISLPRWRLSYMLGHSPNPTMLREPRLEKFHRIGRKVAWLRFLVKTGFRPPMALCLKTREIRHRLRFLLVQHPVDLLADTGLTVKRYAIPEFIGYYEKVVRNIDKPAVCIIEHVGFSSLLPVNSQYSIPTVSCVANVESFDTATPLSYARKRRTYLAALSFADEFRVLAQCNARLFISRSETSLVGGLGLPSHYYPYLPVGTIRRNLANIQQARTPATIKRGLFLLLGSAAHTTTWDSFSWFVQNVQKQGLPSGVRVVVGGNKTDQLLPAGVSLSGLELRGWLEQRELNDLLLQAQAVLVPQAIGFGALTRLPELAYAGIPMIVSRHATYALEAPPGVHVVDDDWRSWYTEMERVANNGIHSTPDEYYTWEENQDNPLEVVLERVIASMCQ